MQLILLLTTFVSAFCSMTYELILAQTLATVLGNTIVQYAITLSVFLTAMGLGAFFFNPKGAASTATLINIELALSALGASIPFVLLWIQYSTQDLSEEIRIWVQPVLSHGLTLIIGYLSGMELPLLMQMAETNAPDTGASQELLAIDYLGMLAATLAFSFLFFPAMGLFSTAVLTAALNVGAAWIIFGFLSHRQNRLDWCLLSGVSASLAMIALFTQSQQTRFIQKYFMGI